MKVKKLLASLLVSILVITNLYITPVYAADTAITWYTSTEKYKSDALLNTGWTRIANNNEFIPQLIAATDSTGATNTSWAHTDDFTSIFSPEGYTEVQNAHLHDTNVESSTNLWRLATLRNTNGHISGLQFEYVVDAEITNYIAEFKSNTMKASDLFYFAKYPEAFPTTGKIKALSNSNSTTKVELYIEYTHSRIASINASTRQVLADANAKFSLSLSQKFGENANSKGYSANKEASVDTNRTYWCFVFVPGRNVYQIRYGKLNSDGSDFVTYTDIDYTTYSDLSYSTPNGIYTPDMNGSYESPEESSTYKEENFQFVINQTVLAARKSSCWTCAQEAIIQNSGCLKGTGYQMAGVVKTASHIGWAKWCASAGVPADAPATPTSKGGYTSYCAVDKMGKLGLGTWTSGLGGSADIEGVAGASGGAYVIGWKNNGEQTYLKDMSVQQLQTFFKALYNSGYWCTIGVRNYTDPPEPGAGASAGGSSDFQSNHTVMFAGIDNNHIMILDSARTEEGTDGSKVADYIYSMDGAYSTYGLTDGKAHNVVYVMVFKNSEEDYSLKKVCGGYDAYMTEADQYNLANMGIQNKKGYFTEEQLSSMVILSESDLAGVLANASIDNLDHNDLESLDMWKDLVEEENMAVKVIRIIIQLIGVLMLLWSILLFAGYHFDRVNNLVDISVVHILTLGRLRPITYDGEEATFGKDKSEKKDKISTVNSRNITTICVVTALFAVLILTGAIYNLLASLVNLINSILRR